MGNVCIDNPLDDAYLASHSVGGFSSLRWSWSRAPDGAMAGSMDQGTMYDVGSSGSVTARTADSAEGGVKRERLLILRWRRGNQKHEEEREG